MIILIGNILLLETMTVDEGNDGENRNRNHRVIQHVRPPQIIILGDNVQRSWEEWIIQYDFWASTQQLEQLPPKMLADSLMATIGPAVIKTIPNRKIFFVISQYEKTHRFNLITQ
jgi:hypothetical protein